MGSTAVGGLEPPPPPLDPLLAVAVAQGPHFHVCKISSPEHQRATAASDRLAVATLGFYIISDRRLTGCV
jgi:hypothetical protein